MRWTEDGTPREEATDTPTALVARITSRLAGPDGEVAGLQVLRPTLEDVYLGLIDAAHDAAGTTHEETPR